MIHVIAGTYNEFWRFRIDLHKSMIENNIPVVHTNIRYVDSIDSLSGLENIWGYRVGTWYNRKDLSELKEMLLSRRSSIDEFIEVDW